MFKPISSFKGFSVQDLAAAKAFYGKVLGLKIDDQGEMGINIYLPGGGFAFVYPKDDHQPATYTMLNFVVEDIDEAVASLTEQGVQFERYSDIPQDEKGILRGLSRNMGPDIAWFKDSAGNILAVVQES